MTLLRYLKSQAGEFALALVAAGSFACVIENAFFLSSVPARVPLSFCACAVLLALLYAASYRRRRMAAGAVVYVAALAAMVAAALALSSGEDPYADAEGNYLYLVLCIAFSATASFLLSRRTAGGALWFLVVAFSCSVVQAFYERNDLVLSIAAAAASLALVIYRNFVAGLEGADVVRGASRAAGLAASLAVVAASCAAALAVWFLVIAPAGPGVLEIKLITEYRQLPVDLVRGVAEEQPTLNLELTTDRDHLLDDEYRYTTDDLVRGESDVVISAQQVLDQETLGGGTTDSGAGTDGAKDGGLDQDSLEQDYDAQSYSTVFPFIVVVLAAIALTALLIAALFALRRRRRITRLRALLAADAPDQARGIYQFLLSRFSRIGFTVPPGFTLSEFARAQSSRMAIFDAAAGVPFVELTRVYEEITFGSRVPTDDDIVPFVAYYLAFWKASRTYLGNFKYFFKSFRL